MSALRQAIDNHGLASEILEYLDAHPHAIDSVEGIASNWLFSSHHDRADVQRALEELVHKGLIQRIALSDGGAAYGRLASRQGIGH